MTTDPKTPRYVAVDLETTSLDVRCAHPLEIAAFEFDPYDGGQGFEVPEIIVPFTPAQVIQTADPDAFAVNRYYERRLYRDQLDPAATARAADRLLALLDGATLVGANPAYDQAVLWSWLARFDPSATLPPWHHRLYDVELATAAALGLPTIPSLRECATAWGIDHDPSVAHTAVGDAFLAADVCGAVLRHQRVAASGGQNGRGGIL